MLIQYKPRNKINILANLINKAGKEKFKKAGIIITEGDNKDIFFGLLSISYCHVWLELGGKRSLLKKFFSISNRRGCFFERILNRAEAQTFALQEAIKTARALLASKNFEEVTINEEPIKAAELVAERYAKNKCPRGVCW